MKVEVKQILSDISYFAKTIRGIRFMHDNSSWSTNFPSIAKWTSGEIVLEARNGYSANRIVERLQGYGIQAQVTDVNTNRLDGVKFTAKSDDDIIGILHKAITDQKQQQEASKMSGQMADLNQNVDMLIEQLPFVKRGVFSRGVNAFRNQVETLKNIRASHTKQH